MELTQRVHGKVRRIRISLFRRIPPPLRGRLITPLTGWLAPAETRWREKPTWWDSFYSAEDPFHFDTNPRETVKYDRTLELCGEGPFQHALEIGCAEGAFTERLAPRCQRLVATDISPVAVARAAERTNAFPWVACTAGSLPAEFEADSFDLIVASDVLYYLTPDDLAISVASLERALAPGGALVIMHYTPPMGALLNGDEVHDELDSLLSLDHTHSERVMVEEAPYRFDRFDKPARHPGRGYQSAGATNVQRMTGLVDDN